MSLRIWLPIVPILWALATTVPGQEAKPVEQVKPAETKPAETKPAEAKPPEATPPEARPAEAKPPEATPAEAKPAEGKPAEEAKTPGEAKAAAEVKAIEKAVADSENSCILCHAELTEKDQQRFLVTTHDFAADIHWQRGVRCQDCHGGDPTVLEIKAHQANDDFRAVKSAADIPEFCGRCHSDVGYMRHYLPSPRTDQLSEYWTSDHGQKLKAGDLSVATCTSCHGKPHGSAASPGTFGVRRVDDLESPVYHTRLAKTCAKCHADEKLMAGREYHGKPIGHAQYEKWRQSVHGKALLDKGDLGAPACNNCHGNHGAVPPEVDSVANACGTCHGKIAKLFGDTRMRHGFENVGLPGCATCHTAHDIAPPSDVMVGMQGGALCVRCHAKGQFGATLAGAKTAETLRLGLEQLKRDIARADTTITQAERLGMEVSVPRFELHKAFDALTNARTLIHSFKEKPVGVALADGKKVAADVQQKADQALQEYTSRRVWLAATLVPIALVIVFLLCYIRTLPVPRP